MFGTAKTAEQLGTIVTIWTQTIRYWIKDGDGMPGWWEDDIAEAVARVNRGAAVLDEQNPTWVYGVIPAKLDMSNASLCIIGQVYGDFGEFVGIPFAMDVYDEENDISLIDEPDSEITKNAISHGFLTEHGPENLDIPYGVLDRVWVYMLTERHRREGEPVFLAMPELN